MELLKKLLLISSAVLLTACAQKFDPVEHSRVVDVHHTAQQALSQHYCSNADTARRTAESLDDHAGWLLVYSQHIPKNESMQVMSAELKKITHDFAQRYQSNTVPSRMYCELKLKNIISVIDVMQRTNARRSR